MKNEDLEEWLEYDSKVAFESKDGKKAYFYAYTFSKKLANRFMQFRNLKRFYVIKRRVEDYFENEEEIRVFERENVMQLIEDCELYTKNFSPNLLTDRPGITIPIPITHLENQFIEIAFEGLDDRLYELEPNLEFEDTLFSCMRGDVRDSLIYLGVTRMIRFAAMNSDAERDEYIVEDDRIDCSIDELKVVLKYFGELFDFSDKKKGE